ncbi:pantetheine-phosphate adenylyltransferase [Paracrocinitomix mangrovi]|uniref:pantetheine-phosphate adenylyltransferase n=1 Tax=Paracrocinitomix mangrovi TaxID=2862509 RepID=UPI001C8E4977|nr:pantetheine-phosphate adenylyltransferase [Paracrocinitomix mangrovi]UKN01437.1 pantetheine-phosphate adenylyltransferase [Paracrocinitomix mangrovi]
MERIGVFPGSFDPFTKGHEDIVRRFIPLFDKIIIAIGENSSKKYMFSLESREKHIKALFADAPIVEVEIYHKLTVEFCKEKKAQYLLRGIRNATDADYERSIAQMNFDISGIETLFLMCDPSLAPINSSIVREIKKNNGDISPFVTNDELLIIN